MKLGLQYRQFQIRAEENKERTVELSFSSDEEIERWWGIEILDHGPDSIIMDRLLAKAPLLLNHDSREQIGVIESARIVDGKGYAMVRFSRSQKAEEIYQDVLDGIRVNVSVGYMIHEMILEEKREDVEVYRVTKWEPMEISIVSVPADISVGVGREEGKPKFEVKIIERGVNMPEEPNGQTPQVRTDPPIDRERIEREAREKELNRVREIMAIGRNFKMEDEAEKAVREGTSVDDFRKLALEKLQTQRHIDANAGNIGMSDKEIKQYSFGRALRAALTEDWSKAGFELEVSREIAKKMGRDPRSFFVPHDVLAKREVTAGGSGAGLVATESMPSSFIELLRAKAKIVALGARTLTGLQGNISIPKQTGSADAYWVTEGQDVTESDSSFGNLDLGPKTVGAATPYSRNMLLQSNPSIEQLVMNDLANVLALAIDKAAIQGTGANGQPTGILNTTGINAVIIDVANGEKLNWEKLVEFETKINQANADIDAMYYLANATVAGLMKTRAKEDGYPVYLLEKGEANGYPFALTNQSPADTLIFGVFSQIIIAMWGGLDIMVDKYAKAASGGVVIRAFQSVDIGIRHAQAFSACQTIA